MCRCPGYAGAAQCWTAAPVEPPRATAAPNGVHAPSPSVPSSFPPPGTTDLNDMLTDACAACVPYCGGYAHLGMLKAVRCGCGWGWGVLCFVFTDWSCRVLQPPLAAAGSRRMARSVCSCKAETLPALPHSPAALCRPQARWFVQHKLRKLRELCDANPGYGLLLVGGGAGRLAAQA